MPGRYIREGINSSPRINALSDGAELFYRRLLLVVDDWGRYYGHPATLLSACWPANPERHTPAKVKRWLEECSSGERPLIRTYEVAGRAFIYVDALGSKLRGKTKFPDPPFATDGSQIVQQPLSARSATAQQPLNKVKNPIGNDNDNDNDSGGGARGKQSLSEPPPPPDADIEKLRALLVDYGREVGRDFGRPDDAICKRIMAACRGDLAGLYQVMLAKLDAGKVPKSLGLFVEFAKEVPHHDRGSA